jgi:putative adenylate-forming enzyme
VTRRGILVAWARQRLRRFPTRAALEAHQRRRLARLLPFVRERSPFFADHLVSADPERLSDVEPVDKSRLMACFERWNTHGVSLERALAVGLEAERSRDFTPRLDGLTVGLSSGTSGTRGVFLVSDDERAAWAGTILARSLPGALVRRHRVAFFLRANSNLYESLGSGRLRFEYFEIARPARDHVGRLRALTPTVVVAPPSVLRQLGALRLSGDLPIGPARVVSVAEVLDPVDEVFIRRAFGQTVHQVYQATEGLIATTCEYGTLHLAEDLVRVDREPLGGGTRRFVPVITDLYRTTQPVIRYRLDDVLVEREYPCLCGSVLTGLAAVDGRRDDVLFVRTEAGRVEALYPDVVRRAVLCSSEGVGPYVVEQTAFDHVRISLEPVPGSAGAAPRVDAVTAAVRQLFASHGSVPVTVETVPAADRSTGVKLRRVVRRFTPPDDQWPEGLRPW